MQEKLIEKNGDINSLQFIFLKLKGKIAPKIENRRKN